MPIKVEASPARIWSRPLYLWARASATLLDIVILQHQKLRQHRHSFRSLIQNKETAGILPERSRILMDPARSFAIVFDGSNTVSRPRIHRAEHGVTGLISGAKRKNPGEKIFSIRTIEKKGRLRRAFNSGKRFWTSIHRRTKGFIGRLQFLLAPQRQAKHGPGGTIFGMRF